MKSNPQERIANLEEIVRQQRAAFAPKLAFPSAWKLTARESAILSALYVGRGTHVMAEALILWVEGVESLAIDVVARGWVAQLRARVETLGVVIDVAHGKGYRLAHEGRAVIAAAIGDEVPTAARPAAAVLPRHRTGWTDPEDAIVRAGYAREATLAVIRADLICARHRPRSIGAISTRAALLGLTNARASSLWTGPEDAIVRQGYDDRITLTAIRLRLADAGFCRKRGAIQARAIALGVSGHNPQTWTQRELAIVKAGLLAGDIHADIIRTLGDQGFERGRTAVARLAQRFGIRRSERPWEPDEDLKLRAFYEAKTPLRAIGAAIERSPAAIASRASKLGILQREPPRSRQTAAVAA